MLKIIDVSKTYAKSKSKSLDKVNLELHGGEIFGLVGPNGAGKSTLIKMIVGILSLNEGDIVACNESIIKNPIAVKQNIGYVSDNHIMFERLSGIEYLNFVSSVYDIDKIKAKELINKYIKIFALEKEINNSIRTYSHGMKQKLCVISALIHEPKIWILDEPLSGLDPKSAFELKQCMKQHAQSGNLVLFSSHVLDVVEKLCDRVAIINKGKIIKIGTPEEIRKSVNSNESLEKVFIELTSSKVEDNE